MMDMSSLIDASLVFGGTLSVLMWAWTTIQSGSATVSTSQSGAEDARKGRSQYGMAA